MDNPIFNGDVEFQTLDKKKVMTFQPSSRLLHLWQLDGSGVVARLGADEFVSANVKVGKIGAHTHVLGSDGIVKFGGAGKGGTLILRDNDGKQRFMLDADSGYCVMGGNGTHGQIMLFTMTAENPNASGQATIHLQGGDASVRVGGRGQNGKINVANMNDKKTIIIDGTNGDISFQNADCAEEFDVDDPDIEPGSVLVMSEEPGRLRLSDSPYDSRVAGVLSGRGAYRPAMVLDRKADREDRLPVALVGKVCCKVEAKSAPIAVGSLLTTSSLPGHAMAVTDRERAFGAVLGKALAPLTAGVGVVPVLVALQ